MTQEHNKVGQRHSLSPLETCLVAAGQFHVARPASAHNILGRTVPNNTAATETCVPVACKHIRAHQGTFLIALGKVPLVLLEFHM